MGPRPWHNLCRYHTHDDIGIGCLIVFILSLFSHSHSPYDNEAILHDRFFQDFHHI